MCWGLFAPPETTAWRSLSGSLPRRVTLPDVRASAAPGPDAAQSSHPWGPGAPCAALRPHAVWLWRLGAAGLTPRVGTRFFSSGSSENLRVIAVISSMRVWDSPPELTVNSSGDGGGFLRLPRPPRGGLLVFCVFREPWGASWHPAAGRAPRPFCGRPAAGRAFGLAPASADRQTRFTVSAAVYGARVEVQFWGPPPMRTLPMSSTRWICSVSSRASRGADLPAFSEFPEGAGRGRGPRPARPRAPAGSALASGRPPRPSLCVFFHVLSVGNAF